MTALASVVLADRVLAQFSPRRVYQNLTFDNRLESYINFSSAFYRNCLGNKTSFQIYRAAEGRGPATFVSSGEIWTKNCGPALDDGEGWLFKETKSSNGKLCQGRLQSFDGVWYFDRAVPGYQCDRVGKSYLIQKSSSAPQYGR